MPNEVKIEGSRDILQAVRKDSRRRMMSRFLRKACTIAVIVGFLNFVLFLVGTFYLGGDAVNGKTEGGKYYLWGYHGGKKGYTQVSRAVFDYSRWHVYSVMVTWPLMILAGFASKRIRTRSED
jgi:hypothetical protein